MDCTSEKSFDRNGCRGFSRKILRQNKHHFRRRNLVFGNIVLFITRLVPGFGEEQTSPDLQRQNPLIHNTNKTFNHSSYNTWYYDPDKQIIVLNWASDSPDHVKVERGWDWERKRPALLFTGLNSKGTAIWGKKMP
jgi:hypothetical protein